MSWLPFLPRGSLNSFLYPHFWCVRALCLLGAQPPLSSLWTTGVSLHLQSNPFWDPECTAYFGLPSCSFSLRFGSLYFWHHVSFLCKDKLLQWFDIINFIRVCFLLQLIYMLSVWEPSCYWKLPLKTLTKENCLGNLHMIKLLNYHWVHKCTILQYTWVNTDWILIDTLQSDTFSRMFSHCWIHTWQLLRCLHSLC